MGPCPLRKQSVRNLGITIDNKLSMKNHVNLVLGTCYGILQKLRKIFKWLPIESRKPLVQGPIVSRLDYGNALLASLNEDLFSKLQILQNTAARLILNLPPRSPSAPSLRSLHRLLIRKRGHFKILCLTHKIIHGTRPSYLAKKLNRYKPGRMLGSSSKSLLALLRICTVRSGGRSFYFLALYLWNKLPFYLLSIADHKRFRKELKTWLFDQK